MSGLTLLQLMCCFLFFGLTFAEAQPVTYGNYICVAHRSVGLQSDPQKRERFAGRIKLSSEEESFLLKIANIENTDREWCRTAKPGVLYLDSEFEYWWSCKTKSEATFSKDKYGLPLRSDGTNVFKERLSGWFHIAQDLKYVFSYTDYGGNYYLEEGVCQKR